jgi:ABC-2 type transport system ATP-binding protein
MYEAQSKQISELSAGMRQKVTLARGLLLDRPVLYLDEPTVSLDVPSARDLREQVSAYARAEHKTVLLTSHNPVDLEICDRCMLLHAGRVVAVGTMDELRAPLRGIQALHVTCANPGAGQNLDALCGELVSLEGVRSVWSDAPANDQPSQSGHRNGGQGLNGHLRLLIRQDRHPTGEIVDRFIAHELPIVAMRTQDVTLQEIYQALLEATDAVQAEE